jgi:hypothetical protein
MNKQLINDEIKKFNIDIKKFNQHKPLSIFEVSIILITIYLLCFIIYKYVCKRK